MGLQSLPGLPAHLPIDWIILAVIVLVFAIDTFRSGAQRACTFALALPVAYILLQLLPHAVLVSSTLSSLSTPLMQALLFIGLTILSAVVIMRIGLSFGTESGQPIQASLAGVGIGAVILAFWFMLPQMNALWTFGPQLQSLFAEQYRFWMLVGGYIALAISRS